MITADLLRAATGSSRGHAALYAPHLDAACLAFGITGTHALAAFLAQLAHESGSLRYVREIADGSAYEGRADLGNTKPGDGRLFRGRGLIQLTGRDNARRFRDAMRSRFGDCPDFEASPELLEHPEWACMSATWFWDTHGLGQFATGTRTGFIQIGRAINRGNPLSEKPANGEADRLARWEMAKAALATYAPAQPETPASAPPDAPQPYPDTIPAGDAPDWTPPLPKERPMAPFIIPAVIELAKLIPKLGGMFGGSEVAQRNVAAAGVVVDAVTAAVGASNAQEAVEKIQADPAAREAANQAVEGVWYQITEAGGGGIDGAGKRDAATAASGDMLRSPSFWIAALLLPLVYLLVLSLIGIIGTATWSDDVRAGLSGSLISAIIGGVVGYYYGQTTSRNRTPPA